MLTTVDNPYDPTNQFDEWYQFDVRKGYNSLSLLSRLAFVSDEMSDEDIAFIIESAIDEIIQENISGVHTKVLMKETEKETEKEKENILNSTPITINH